VSSRRSSQKVRSTSQLLWLRSTVLVALIVLTSSLQRVSDTLHSEPAKKQSPTENADSDWLQDPKSFISRESLDSSSVQSLPHTLESGHFKVGDIVFLRSGPINRQWPRLLIDQLTPQKVSAPQYDQVAVVTGDAKQFFAVYSERSPETIKGVAENHTANKTPLSDFLDQIESSNVVVVYRLGASAPKGSTDQETRAIAAAATRYYQNALKSSPSITEKPKLPERCPQLVHSVYSAIEITTDATCLGFEQLSTDKRWQQIDLSQPVPAVQSSLD